MKTLLVLLVGATLPVALLHAVPATAAGDTDASAVSRTTSQHAGTQANTVTGSRILPIITPSTSLHNKAARTAPERISNAWRALRMSQVPARYDGTGILVAVIDSGVKATLPNLAGQVLPGKDFNATPTKRGWHDPIAFGGHGTGVASIIVGKGHGTGVRGVARGARVLPVRVANRNGFSPDARIAHAIRWAVTHDADVINLSMGSSKPNKELHAAIRYAVRKGTIFVAGAGNDGPSLATPFYPAAYPEAIAVGASRTSEDVVAQFSVRGDWVDVVAPGTLIPNTCTDGTVCQASGTSFSAPFVAGVAALMLHANPNLNQDRVRRILTSTARDIEAPGFDNDTGYGIINAGAAVKRARDLYRGTTR